MPSEKTEQISAAKTIINSAGKTVCDLFIVDLVTNNVPVKFNQNSYPKFGTTEARHARRTEALKLVRTYTSAKYNFSSR